MACLKLIQFGIAMAVALAAGAFAGAQFYVKWGGECAYGERFNRSSQTYGFPAPAIHVRSTVDRAEVDPFQRNKTSFSVDPDAAALNFLALAAALIFAGRVAEKLFSRLRPATFATTGTAPSSARNPHRLSFPRACP
jgi:hypothetical protein